MEIKLHYNNLEELQLKGVYLIRNLDNNLLKIGICKNLKDRFIGIKRTFKHIGLEPNLNIECFIECGYNAELENHLHKTFDSKRVKNEWFNIDNIESIILEAKDFKYKPKENRKLKALKTKEETKEIKKELKYYKFKYCFDDTFYTIAFRSYYKCVNFEYLNNICHELGYNKRYDYFYIHYNDMMEDDDIKECEELNEKFENIDCNYIIEVNNKWISIKEFLKPIILDIKQKEIDNIKTTLINTINNFNDIDLNNYEEITEVYDKMYNDMENLLYIETSYYSKRYIHK